MVKKIEQADLDAVLDPDYFVRYDACDKILQENDIPLKIADLRRVFSLIIEKDDNTAEETHQQLLRGQAELIQFINSFGKSLDFAQLTRQQVNDLFLDACYRTSVKPDLNVIQELVIHGADIKAHDERGFAALKLATGIYDRDIMKYFLEQGADINEVIHYRDQKTSTVWLEKIKYAETQDLQIMLQYGARPNDRDWNGNSALLNYCAGKPVCEGVALLLNYGADPTVVNADGNSPLHLIATVDAESEAVKLLIKSGASVNQRNLAGDTPLHCNSRFALAGNEKVTICLLEHEADPEITNPAGETPLLLAASCDKKLVVKALVENGANCKKKNSAGKTAYEVALSKNFIETASYINPEARSDYDKGALSSGVNELKAQILQRLKNGQNQYQSDREGYSLFSRRDDVYLHERFENGAHPPVVSTYPTDESALEYLYETNRSYSASETELSIYQRVLNSFRE